MKLQDRLAREIAGRIGSQLETDAPAPVSSASSVEQGGVTAYLKGRYFWNKRPEQGYVQSDEQFQEAIRLAPAFAAAHAGLADTYIFLGIQGFRLPAETYPKAEDSARKALALDSSLAEVHNSLAQIQDLYYWNYLPPNRSLNSPFSSIPVIRPPGFSMPVY